MKPKNEGTDTICITSDRTTDQLNIKVNVIDKPKKEKLDDQAIFDKSGSSTVEITAISEGEESMGSGFFIAGGMIITSYHMIDGADEIFVKTYEGAEYPIYTIIGYDYVTDLAILKLDIDHKYLNISQDKVSEGQDVYAIGSPPGSRQTILKGLVLAPSCIVDNVDYIQLDTSISSANSSCPIANTYGEVIGINIIKYSRGKNQNFAININELQKISTNAPISITDYDVYSNLKVEKDYNYTIYEDPERSQSIEDCQELLPGDTLEGSVTEKENGDNYFFHVFESGFLFAAIEYSTLEGSKKAILSLSTYNGDAIISGAQGNNQNLYIRIDLQPGDYIIKLSLPEGYTGEAVGYKIYLLYYE